MPGNGTLIRTALQLPYNEAMRTRKLGPFAVSAIGLGCMSMSHAYGKPDDEESAQVLHRALDLGYSMLDSAALYGFGKNEILIGKTLKERRN